MPRLSQQTFLCSSSSGLCHPACPGLHALPDLRLVAAYRAVRLQSYGAPGSPPVGCLKEHRSASHWTSGSWAVRGGHNHETQSARGGGQWGPTLREAPSGRGRSDEETVIRRGWQVRAALKGTTLERFLGDSPSWTLLQTLWDLFPPLLAGQPCAGTSGMPSLGLQRRFSLQQSVVCV